MIIWGQGARRLSAKGLKEEIELANRQIQEQILEMSTKEKTYLKDIVPFDFE